MTARFGSKCDQQEADAIETEKWKEEGRRGEDGEGRKGISLEY